MDRCPRPQCFRAGPDLGNCGEHALGCPRFVPVDPQRDLVLHCSKCGVTRAIPLDAIMRGQTPPKCQGDVQQCQAVLVLQDKQAAKAPPPPAPKKK